MNIYHLFPARESAARFKSPSSFRGFVIVARDERSARAHVIVCGAECDCGAPIGPERPRCVWSRSDVTTCDWIGVAREGVPEDIVQYTFL